MTTPLLISESVALEIRNILKSLEIGSPIRYKGLEGYICFTCNDYISMCFHEYEHGDPSARQPTTQCCLLIYQHDWDEIEIEDSHFYNHKAYHGYIPEHPGNDMLPEGERPQ